jgi:hypothetical protein
MIASNERPRAGELLDENRERMSRILRQAFPLGTGSFTDMAEAIRMDAERPWQASGREADRSADVPANEIQERNNGPDDQRP